MTNTLLHGRKTENIRSGFYVLLFIVCPFGLLLALWLRNHPHRRWLGLVSVLWLLPVWGIAVSDIAVPVKAAVLLVASAGLCGICLWLIVWWEWVMSSTLDDFLSRYNRPQATPPTDRQTSVILGQLAEPGQSEEWMGVDTQAQWLSLSLRALTEHVLLIGATGAGKSTTIYQLVDQIASTTDWDIFVVDGKGEKKFAYDIANIIYKHRGTPVPIFLLGHDEMGSVYDSMRGTPTAIYNRLIKLLGVDQMVHEDRHYAEMYRTMMRLVCKAPCGPPRSLMELYQRIDLEWVQRQYLQDPVQSLIISRLSIYNKELMALSNRIASLMLGFNEYMGPEGFGLEDGSAVFSVVKLSLGDDGQRLLDFLIEDTGDGVMIRRQRPAVLIIDEFGVFDGSKIKEILKTGRSKDFGVVLATQTTTSLGDMDSRKDYLGLCNTLFAMCSNVPDELVNLAGTIQYVDATFYQEDGESTGRTSVSVREKPRIPASKMQSLRPGEGYLIRKGASWKVKVPAMPAVTHNQQAVKTYTKQTSTSTLPRSGAREL